MHPSEQRKGYRRGHRNTPAAAGSPAQHLVEEGLGGCAVLGSVGVQLYTGAICKRYKVSWAVIRCLTDVCQGRASRAGEI